MKTTQKLLMLFLTLSLLLSSLALSSCSPPELHEVKDTFTKLIADSLTVNEILYGEGLSVYKSLTFDEKSGVYYTLYTTKADGKLCAIYDSETREYTVLRFGNEGESGELYYESAKDKIWLYKTDLTFSDSGKGLTSDPPINYHYVRLDERCTSVKEITELARSVYSEDYLRDVFSMLIGTEDGSATGENVSSRYYEVTIVNITPEGDVETKALVKADESVIAPIVTTPRSYDYDTMKIKRNSRKNFVSIEIQSYGTYMDAESGEIKTGNSWITLSFIKENGAWKLDSPTY